MSRLSSAPRSAAANADATARGLRAKLTEIEKARDVALERVHELVSAGDPLKMRAEYERMQKERDEALARAARAEAALKTAHELLSVAGNEKRQTGVETADRLAALGYERDCAQDDFAAAKDAILALAGKVAALEKQLRRALRDPPPPRASTYAGPLARPLTAGDAA